MARKTVIYTIGIVIIGLMIYLPGFIKYQELKARSADLERRVSELGKENSALREEKLRLEKDLTYIERIAREKLGVTRKGEVIYKVVPSEE